MNTPPDFPVDPACQPRPAYLRISVTDRCQARCVYCLGRGPIDYLDHEDVLRYEEIMAVVDALIPLGLRKVRLTGGEPLVRKGLPTLVSMLREREAIETIALTTNGLLLARHAAELAEAGLDRVNVSLDTLDTAVYRELMGVDSIGPVVDGIDAAIAAGLTPLHINTVVMKGVNHDHLADLAAFAVERGAQLRLLELQSIGFSAADFERMFVPYQEILPLLAATLDEPLHQVPARGLGPAQSYETEDGRRFGVISSQSWPDCANCSRLRLRANGEMITCLHSGEPLQLRELLRAGDTAGLSDLIASVWRVKRSGHPLMGGSMSTKPLSTVGG